MPLLVSVLVVFFLASAALGQVQPAESAKCVRIGKLVLVSKDLPDADRQRITRRFEKKTYPQPEIGERIAGALRDLGYFKAVAEEPKVFGEDVTVTVRPGVQYRLGGIRIEHASVFPAARLRNLFPMHRGEIFIPTKFVEGLESIRSLYATQGYVDLVAVPEAVLDESRHRIDLIVEVDENRRYNFGHLYLEGIEPHPGAGKALYEAWKPLEGKRYNSIELQHWLRMNHAAWKVGLDATRRDEDPNTLAVNITLTQWPRVRADLERRDPSKNRVSGEGAQTKAVSLRSMPTHARYSCA
jgi:outer membrane protein assembly factor BamA